VPCMIRRSERHSPSDYAVTPHGYDLIYIKIKSCIAITFDLRQIFHNFRSRDIDGFGERGKSHLNRYPPPDNLLKSVIGWYPRQSRTKHSSVVIFVDAYILYGVYYLLWFPNYFLKHWLTLHVGEFWRCLP
jgi:hypothetical protein